MLGSTTSRTEGAFAIVTDKDIPADGAPWTYRVALSDVFGRFGDPTEIDVPYAGAPAHPPTRVALAPDAGRSRRRRRQGGGRARCG